MKRAKSQLPLYLKVAQGLEHQIQQGAFRLGDPVPSIRDLSRQQGVSISTVLQAYFWLENRGWIEARPKSGFYVKQPAGNLSPEPAYRASEPRPKPISIGDLVVEVLKTCGRPIKFPLGAACPSADRMPNRALNTIIRRVSRRMPVHSMNYDVPPGVPALCQQIAKRSIEHGCNFSPQDLIITCGALEALNLCLRAIGKTGDVIVTESPTYFGVLQAIDSLGMKAIEIPAHCRTGVNLELLEESIKKHRVRAYITMTNCQNPLGYVLTDDKKRALVDLLARHEIPLIEDDVYGDLAFGTNRPRTAKSFDRRDLVMLCGSFSKTVAPGLRIGWVQGGRYHAEIERLKLLTNLASASLPQLAIAEFMQSGGYDRHIRSLRIAFEQQVQMVSQAVTKYFPAGTCVSRPAGGYVLWVELPKNTDSVSVYRAALAEGISISPGPIFSPSGKFRNYIRLNCGRTWSEELDRAVLKLGRLCEAH